MEANGKKEKHRARMEGYITLKGDEWFGEFKIKVDAVQTPKAIDLTVLRGSQKGWMAAGIYCLKDGQLTLCFPEPAPTPAKRPTEFKTKPGDGLHLVVFRRRPPAPLAAPRTWTDNTGAHRVTAQYVDQSPGAVRIKKVDGKIVAVPLDRLSEADRQYVLQRTVKRTRAATGHRTEIVDVKATGEWNEAERSIHSGRLDEAIAHYRNVLKIMPEFPEAHSDLGRLLIKTRRTEEAIEHCHKALELDPEYVDAHNGLGQALAVCGRLDEAMAHCRTALAIQPDCAEAYNIIGEILARRGQTSEAMAHFRTALEINPDFYPAEKNLQAAEEAQRAKK
jgi:uncharacterized protein (TIGR03067 family)